MTPLAAPTPNRLAGESSVYLRSLARQPIDWFPWGEEAFAAASALQRPVVLSVGYAANPWCRRMDSEGFGDAEVVAVLNARFVCVKVDRNERPDIDRVYQTAVQALTRENAGWPLTAFLTAEDRLPFFGGTFFDVAPTDSSPGLAEVLRRIADYHAGARDTIDEQHLFLRQSLPTAVERTSSPPTPADLSLADNARERLAAQFDPVHGGFGGAPKFPQPGLIDRLFAHWSASQRNPVPDLHALYMASLSLVRMAESAVHDITGGGFFRHCADTAWSEPTDEKTLADNGLLLSTYANAAIATGEPLFAATGHAIADWLLTSLRRPDGLFYAGETGGGESPGGFTLSEILAHVPTDTRAVLDARYGLGRDAQEPTSRHRLHAAASLEAASRQTGLPPAEVNEQLDRALHALRNAVRHRPPPTRDPTLLWRDQGMAIYGLSVAGRTLGRSDCTDAARACLNGILGASPTKGLLGWTSPIVLDDLAWPLAASLDLLQTQWETTLLDGARSLADRLLSDFADPADGTLYWTARDAQHLIFRPVVFADEAHPAAGGVAARSLFRLGYLLDELRYTGAAEKALGAALAELRRQPAGHGAYLDALEDAMRPAEWVVLRGPAEAVQAWQRELARLYAPGRTIWALPNGANVPAFLTNRWSESAMPVAYRYRGTTLQTVAHDFQSLLRALRDGIDVAPD